MEKSIENIWTRGFMNSEELIAPKVMNLYNQKSKLLLEKFKKTYQMDNKSIIPIALVFGVSFSLLGHIVLGCYGASLMIAMYFFNRKLLQSLEHINIATNSYEYLVKYRNVIKKIMNATTKLLGLGAPIAIILGYWLFFRKTEMYVDIMSKVSVFNLILSVIGFAIFISVLAIVIYKIVTKLVYGKHLSVLDELISDMETLRS